MVLDNDDEDYDMELRIENIDLEDEEKLEKLGNVFMKLS